MLFGMKAVENLSRIGNNSVVVFPIQVEPSPSNTRRAVSRKPRRVASRRTRAAIWKGRVWSSTSVPAHLS
jgi:hypothetical protein